MADRRLPLKVLDSRIEERATAMREKHPWWPCAKGCDPCCRSLPHLPTVTRTEWERLAPALTDEMKARLVAPVGPAPVTCPLLDREHGVCLTYEVRPITCRTYGFYVERDAGLHCNQVTEAVASHDDAVTWGNGEAIAEDLRPHGELKTLAEWLTQNAR